MGRRRKCLFDLREFIKLLRRCATLKEAKDVHALVSTSSVMMTDKDHSDETLQLANVLVATYGRLGSARDARSAYDAIHRKNSYSLHAMLKAYLDCGCFMDARHLFEGWPGRPDVYSCTSMVAFYSSQGCLSLARLAFSRAQRPLDAALCNAMLACIAHNASVADAAAFFQDEMLPRDATSFNTMLLAFAETGQVLEARKVFEKMPLRSSFSWTTMVASLAEAGRLDQAKCVFDSMPERDVVAGNVMVNAFASTGHYVDAKRVFDRMPQLTAISWTTLLAGFAERGHVGEASWLFDAMPERDVVAWTAMLAAFGHAGQISSAEGVFHKMPHRSLVSWNAMLAAYAQVGRHDGAVCLVATMLAEGISPDPASFSGILAACSHVGSVEKGIACFTSISDDHGIQQSKEHYCCMVDLLGRAGYLAEAEELVVSMPFADGADAWQALLGASRHADKRMAEAAARMAADLGSRDGAPYTYLARHER